MNIVTHNILALFLLGLSAFSVFGFLASGELPAAAALPWRIGYFTLGVASVVGIGVMLVVRPAKP